ncbi:MAG: response regulator [Leptolyngbya sp. SIO1D8]|nr:response regulator [Leptolyngbya sp. SIO1D8]
MSNAIKFTPHGSVVLRATPLLTIEGSTPLPAKLTTTPTPECPPPTPAKPAQAVPIWIRFEVEDTGPGIAPQQREQLFNAFVQTVGHRSQEGTGLGLAICREYTQLMGGHIEVLTGETGGALFRVDLPMQLAELRQLPQATARRITGLAANQSTFRILVVHDQLADRQLLEELLGSVGFQVSSAGNGADAIACYQRWHPHLIWMDMNMPVMDGYETTRRIRAMEVKAAKNQENTSVQAPEIPGLKRSLLPYPPSLKIIALATSAFQKDQTMILAAGCDQVVCKPYQEQEIFDVLAEHLGVAYQYQTDSPSEQGHPALRSPPLQGMSSEWTEELQQAAIQADRDWLIHLITQIPQSQNDLTAHLTYLVDHLDFDALIELAENQTHAEAS